MPQPELIPYEETYVGWLPQVERLYKLSFPKEERRPWGEELGLISSSDCFRLELVSLAGEFVGFLSSWHFEQFIFAEHFAIIPAMRSRGIGKTILRNLWQAPLLKPWVFEVEPPTTSIAKRRIALYVAQGAEIIAENYLQPPYRAGDLATPLFLMKKGDPIPPLTELVSTIHQKVYPASPPSKSQ